MSTVFRSHGISGSAIFSSPSSGNIAASGTVTLTAKFPSVVTVVGTPTLNLNTGGTASYVSGSGSNTLIFSYTVNSGDTPQASLAVIGSIPFKTSFADFSPENPISQNGAWIRKSTSNWFTAKTIASPMRAVGNAPSPGSNDTYAHLQSGMTSGVVQTAIATVYNGGGITVGTGQTADEIELHSRWVDTTSTARGYELNYNYNGTYVTLVRWNGNVGDFVLIGQNFNTLAPATGDTFKCVTTGHTVVASIDKHDGSGFQELLNATDTNSGPFADGEVGMGFFIDNGAVTADQDKIGFTDYMATSGTIAINDGGGAQVKTAFMITTFIGLGILQ